MRLVFRWPGLSLVTATVAVIAAAPAMAVNTAQDLAAVIALQGQPCGTVVSFEERGENDFVARCADGNVYRVFVSPQGRVVVERQS
jgi:hypothetical protein